MENFNIFDQSIINEILFLFNANNRQIDYLCTSLSHKFGISCNVAARTLDIAPFTNIHHNIPVFFI